jgi:hypothetical protein
VADGQFGLTLSGPLAKPTITTEKPRDFSKRSWEVQVANPNKVDEVLSLAAVGDALHVAGGSVVTSGLSVDGDGCDGD